MEEKYKWLIAAIVAVIVVGIGVWSIIQHINYEPINDNDPQKARKESIKLAYLICGVLGAGISLILFGFFMYKYLTLDQIESDTLFFQTRKQQAEARRRSAKPYSDKRLEVLVVCANLDDQFEFEKITKELAYETNQANITLLRLPKSKIPNLKREWTLEGFVKQDLESINPDIDIRIVQTVENNLVDFLMDENVQVPSYDMMFWAGCNDAIDERQLSDLDDLLNDNNRDMTVYMMRDGEFMSENPFTNKFIAMIESDDPKRPNIFKLFGYQPPSA